MSKHQRFILGLNITTICISVVSILISINTIHKLNSIENVDLSWTYGSVEPEVCDQLRRNIPQSVEQLAQELEIAQERVIQLYPHTCGDSTDDFVNAGYLLDAGPDVWLNVPPQGEIFMYFPEGGVTKITSGAVRTSERTLVYGNTTLN